MRGSRRRVGEVISDLDGNVLIATDEKVEDSVAIARRMRRSIILGD